MKITEIKTEIKSHELLPQLHVKIVQQDGAYGIGECWWGVTPGLLATDKRWPRDGQVQPMAATVNNILEPLLIGLDPGNIEFCHQTMVRYAYRYGIEGIMSSAISGIDLALWDLAGKRMGISVVELMGGQVKDCIKAYASLPPIRDTERLAAECRRVKAAGFRGIKLHEYDPELAGLAREIVGPELAIMFDVNGHFAPDEAKTIAERLKINNVYWFEEPTWPMRDLQAMRKVKEATGICIAAGENEFGFEGLYHLIKENAADHILPEISKIGGLTVARKLNPLFEHYNLPFSPHNYRIGPALYANIHWALSSMKSEWLEIPWLPEGVSFPSGIPMPELTDGMVKLPEGTGLGLPEI